MASRVNLPQPLQNVGRGFLMGGADIIPGVSGGTVALILGIYERLVTAISRFDLTFLGHMRRREFAAAVRHIDLLFLATLMLGIGTGILGLGSVMHYLLEHQMQYTFGAFFGLILASSWHVARIIDGWSQQAVGLLLVGALFAYLLVGLPFLDDPPQALWYVFFCGCISICAMILPGISGAFILLILGTYDSITGALRGVAGSLLKSASVSLESLAILGVFGAGAAIGLLSFSKVLKWLLGRYEKPTLALLCGFMLGSLRKIWPFKFDTTPLESVFKRKQFRNDWPDWTSQDVWLTIGIAAIAFGFVLLLERFGATDSQSPAENSASE